MRFCGAAGCRDVTSLSLVRMLQAAQWQATPTWPSPPRGYYTIRLLDRAGRAVEALRNMPRYFVPGASAIVRESSTIRWLALGAWAADYRAATRGLRPFPRPRVARVAVGGRTAADPQSYLRLYEVRGRRAADPAGLHPTITGEYSDHAVAAYYARLRRHWMPVSIWTARPSPWGDDASFV